MGLLALAGVPLAAPALAQQDAPGQDSQQPRVWLPLLSSNPSALVEEFAIEDDGESQPYVLRQDDDLSQLALDIGRDVSLMACVTSSALQPLAELRPGQTIRVPAAHYRCHTAAEGETVQEIARLYGVPASALVETAWNRLSGEAGPLEAGRRVLVPHARPVDLGAARASAGTTPASSPGAEAVQPAVWPYGDGQFVWPVDGVISQGFHGTHKALDIAVKLGTPVRAADNGIVVKAGYTTVGYGGRIIIDHQIDYTTLYAHLSQSLVEEGDVVQKGQIIGFVGSTGNSTGPHLHFELRDFGYLIDPRPLLHHQ